MKNKGWILRGIGYGLALWLIVYVLVPYIDADVPLEPEKYWLHLLFAVPAGIAWGYYRFVMLPKRMKKRKDQE
jgi:hypothetical protein